MSECTHSFIERFKINFSNVRGQKRGRSGYVGVAFFFTLGQIFIFFRLLRVLRFKMFEVLKESTLVIRELKISYTGAK